MEKRLSELHDQGIYAISALEAVAELVDRAEKFERGIGLAIVLGYISENLSDAFSGIEELAKAKR